MSAARAQCRLPADMNIVLRGAWLRLIGVFVRLIWINRGPESGSRLDMCVIHGSIVEFSGEKIRRE